MAMHMFNSDNGVIPIFRCISKRVEGIKFDLRIRLCVQPCNIACRLLNLCLVETTLRANPPTKDETNSENCYISPNNIYEFII